MGTRRLILALGLGSCLALGGCGGSSGPDGGLVELSAAQKAEKEARDRATLDAFKEHQKQVKRGGPAGQGRKTQVVNGVRTS